MTESQEIEEFLADIQAEERTKRRYRGVLLSYRAWSEGLLPASVEDAQAYIWHCQRVKGNAANTLAVISASLRRYLSWRHVPAGKLEHLPVQRSDPEYLSLQEVRALLDACDMAVMKCLTALLYDTGARIGEVLGVRVDQVDWDGFITVRRKGGKEEKVPVSEWGLSYLREWIGVRAGDTHLKVFGDWSYQDVYPEFRRTARKAGIKNFHPHMLRHSRAVHLRQEDPPVDWGIIGYLLGHKNPTMTMSIYGRLTPEDLRKEVPAPRI